MVDSAKRIGFVHPGQMGVSIAAAVQSNGHTACWASDGRSQSTSERAASVNMTDVGDLSTLCNECDVVFSICPPDQAVAVASSIAGSKFNGIYVDGNAVSPGTAREVAKHVSDAGASFVDGGIIGPPARKPGTTRFYASGERADEITALFSGSVVDARVVEGDATAASALKMAFAGWSKGSTALLLTQLALARSQGVEQELIEEWAMMSPGTYESLTSQGPTSAAKAWRFVGEMHEIADALDDAGLSRAWFDGAAATYERLNQYKDEPDHKLGQIVATLLGKPPR